MFSKLILSLRAAFSKYSENDELLRMDPTTGGVDSLCNNPKSTNTFYKLLSYKKSIINENYMS